jgi:proteasome lid subunit RPN8/RPN11
VSDVATVATMVGELLIEARTDLIHHRNEVYPHECVGIICYDALVFPLINQARSDHRFEVGTTLVGEAINHLKYRDKVPVAVYHSHPERDSDPSDRDLMMMREMDGAVFVIIGNNGIAAWLWDDELRFITKIPLED